MVSHSAGPDDSCACSSDVGNLALAIKAKSKGLNIYTNYSVYTKIKYMNKMVTFTISIPEELKKKIDEHPEINWAEYLKKRFVERMAELKKFEELKSRGKI